MSNNSIVVPPPPYQSPFVGASGMLNSAWSYWLRQVYERIGGASSPSNAGFASDIETLQTQVTLLQTEVGTLNTEMTKVTNIANGLSVGRQL